MRINLNFKVFQPNYENPIFSIQNKSNYLVGTYELQKKNMKLTLKKSDKFYIGNELKLNNIEIWEKNGKQCKLQEFIDKFHTQKRIILPTYNEKCQ